MPVLSPRQFQGAYLPIEPDRAWLLRVFTAFERTSKGMLFGCRMCGNCLLQETAFVCPMTCAKGLRNGFCGEASEARCVVESSRPCTWLRIFHRAERMGRMDRLLEINAPIDGAQAGHSSQLQFLRHWSERRKPSLFDLASRRKDFAAEWEKLCQEVRQPEWWQGDRRYHPPGHAEPASRLEQALRTQPFVLTGEIETGLDNDLEPLVSKADLLRGYVAAANFSDNAFATSRLNSLACSQLSLENGLEPVMQIQARDRSRNGFLSEAMGASALGIRNLLCLGGDYHNRGPRPWPVQPDQFDLDSIQMLWMLRRLRDEGRHIDGRQVKVQPKFFLGAAGSPFTLSPAYNALRTEKKINAGAQFLQTQMVFDPSRFTGWLEALDRRSLLDKVYILAGVCPLRSKEDALRLAQEPGILLPRELVERMQLAAERDQAHNPDEKRAQVAEGVQIAVEIIERLIHTPGIHGIHLLVSGQEEILPRIIREAGLAAFQPPLERFQDNLGKGQALTG